MSQIDDLRHEYYTEALKTHDLTKYLFYNETTDMLEATKSIQGTLASFFLGGVHGINSGGEYISFHNDFVHSNFFPLTSGIKDQSVLANQDSTGLIEPTVRVFVTDYLESPGNGNPIPASSVPYETVTPPGVYNFTVFGIVTMVAEAVSIEDELTYHVYWGSDDTGLETFNQKLPAVSLNPGDTLDWFFDQPVAAPDNIGFYSVIRLNGVPLQARAGDFDISRPYAVGRIRVTESKPIALREEIGAVFYTSADADALKSGEYPVETDGGPVTLTVDVSEGIESFLVFDATSNFNVNACTVDFGAQGPAVLNLKNDMFKFFWDGTQWRYLEVQTKAGGIV